MVMMVVVIFVVMVMVGMAGVMRLGRDRSEGDSAGERQRRDDFFNIVFLLNYQHYQRIVSARGGWRPSWAI